MEKILKSQCLTRPHPKSPVGSNDLQLRCRWNAFVNEEVRRIIRDMNYKRQELGLIVVVLYFIYYFVTLYLAILVQYEPHVSVPLKV